jgi:NADPH:quinone reductase-like Zn-dependent oxidoreductase
MDTECVMFEGGDFKLSKCSLPKLGHNDVLIKVSYSTFNPFDKILFDKVKEMKSEGKILGSEGCGTIVDVGENIDPNIKGRRVAFGGDAWSKHVSKDIRNVIVLDENIELSDCANAFLNPMTACA